MSHFSLLVLTKKKMCIDEVLEPFNENILCAPYVVYTKEEFKAKLRRDLHEYKKGSTYQEWIKDKEAYKLKHGDNLDHINYLEKTFPQLMKMSNERLYKREIHRYYEPNQVDFDGNIMSTCNPNSKWDWYVVGGRWDGLLTTKNGEKVNSGYAKNLNFLPDPLEKEAANLFWELWVEKRPPVNEKEQKIVDSFNYTPEYYLERYETKENYANKVSLVGTYAVLMPDGVWQEPGKVRCFGMSEATSDSEKDWDSNYYKFIEYAQKKNLYMTIVDCHI